MPRKFKTEASVQQDRENQRRSRARRKDYVQDLETRIREFERQGVDASAQMQQAARAVEAENLALRSILAEFLTPGEIEARLRMNGPMAMNGSEGSRSCPTDAAYVQQPSAREESYNHPAALHHTDHKMKPHDPSYTDVQYHPALKTSTMEKSCTEAALILSQLGGHSDARRIRTSLGCVGDEECVVRNTVLMQMMDREVT